MGRMTCIPSKAWLRAEASDQGWNELLVPWLGLECLGKTNTERLEAPISDAACRGPGRQHRRKNSGSKARLWWLGRAAAGQVATARRDISRRWDRCFGGIG